MVADSLHILYVVPNVPSLVRVRPYNLIKRLSTRHRVHLVSLAAQADEERHIERIAPYCETVSTVRLGRAEGAMNMLRGLATGLPLRLAYFQSSTLRAHLAKDLVSKGYDICHLEHAKVLPVVNGFQPGPLPAVLDAVDSLTLLMERYRHNVSNGPLRILTTRELERTRRFESMAFQHLDRVTVTSDVDATRIRQLTQGRVDPVIVPNGVDSQFFGYHDGPRDPASVAFIAKLDYFPNAEAAKYFVNSILPLVIRHRQDVKVSIVGSNPPLAVQKLAVPQRVEVTGYVTDVRSYLHRATLAVAPLLTKAGMQNKILEALASGTPIVATYLAAEGLQVVSGRHLLLAQNAEEFASHILRLLADEDLRRRLAARGRQLVLSTYEWDRATRLLEDVYEDVITRHRAA